MMIHRPPGRYFVAALLSLAVTAASLAQQQPPAAATTQSASDAAASIVVPGSVAAFYAADLYAKDSGYLSDVKVDIGDHVKKGDLLAVIDDPELQQQLSSTQALLAAKQEQAKAAESGVQQSKALLDVAKRQLAALQAERDLAQATLKRQEELFKEKAATNQQMDEMRAKAQVAGAAADVGEAKIASAEADVHAAEAARAVAAAQVQVTSADLDRIRTLLGYTKVIAPFDGVITRRLVSPGDLVQSAITNRNVPLFTCQKVDVVRVFCDVPEGSASAMRAGLKAEVRLSGNAAKPIPATVARVSGAMDPATRTMRIEIDLPNPDAAMRPGMYAQVTLSLQPAAGVAEADSRR
jgi:multidrug efflux pump subunit AcrA (membrane-fusion protein)